MMHKVRNRRTSYVDVKNAFLLTAGFDFVLSLSVTTPLITPVMDMSSLSSIGKDCFDMLKSIGFGDLVRLFASLRRSDRVYLG